jgi:hypothetical protein
MAMERMPQDEGVGAANYPGGFQLTSNAASGVSRAEQDKLLGWG